MLGRGQEPEGIAFPLFTHNMRITVYWRIFHVKLIRAFLFEAAREAIIRHLFREFQKEKEKKIGVYRTMETL